MSTRDGNEEEGQAALQVLANSPYIAKLGKAKEIRLLMLSCALYAENFSSAAAVCRWFCSLDPLSPDGYRLFMGILPRYITLNFSGNAGQAIFSTRLNQNFFRRQLKLVEEHYEKEGTHLETYVQLLIICGQMNSSARFFYIAILHFLKAYKLTPNNPMISLCIGIGTSL